MQNAAPDPVSVPPTPLSRFRRDARLLEAFALQTLALHLARATHRFSSLTRTALRRLLKVATKLHFAKDSFALHLLLKRLERLIDIVVANENLHLVDSS